MIENVTPPLAFQSQPLGQDGLPDHSAVSGMALRDWFATFAPEPPEAAVDAEHQRDRLANPHNEPRRPKVRSTQQIMAAIRYRFADAMLEARKA